MVSTRATVSTELLAASLFLAVLFAVATPFRNAVRSQADIARCVAARRLLVDALERKVGPDKSRIVALTPDQIDSILPAAPACPSGGRYRLKTALTVERYSDGTEARPGDLLVQCDHDGHGRCRAR